jgi:hypothetical protein
LRLYPKSGEIIVPFSNAEHFSDWAFSALKSQQLSGEGGFGLIAYCHQPKTGNPDGVGFTSGGFTRIQVRELAADREAWCASRVRQRA